MSVLASSADRLIRPLDWLQPDIPLAACVQRPFGSHDGWINLNIHDSNDPQYPHVLCAATLQQNSAGAYRALGIAGVHTSFTPLVRVLCTTAHAQLEHEIASGPPRHLLPLAHAKKAANVERDRAEELTLSAMGRLSSRQRIVIAAAASLAGINQLPVDGLPMLEDCAGRLPCDALTGWFVLSPRKPPPVAKLRRDAVPA
jgi:hypothetical protein